MLCSNQAMILSALRYFEDSRRSCSTGRRGTTPAAVDVYLVLYNGGSFYVDDRRYRARSGDGAACDVSPTWYFNVPKGFEALLPISSAMPVCGNPSSEISKCCGTRRPACPSTSATIRAHGARNG
jgi:feruloyl-CoA synthase